MACFFQCCCSCICCLYTSGSLAISWPTSSIRFFFVICFFIPLFLSLSLSLISVSLSLSLVHSLNFFYFFYPMAVLPVQHFCCAALLNSTHTFLLAVEWLRVWNLILKAKNPLRECANHYCEYYFCNAKWHHTVPIYRAVDEFSQHIEVQVECRTGWLLVVIEPSLYSLTDILSCIETSESQYRDKCHACSWWWEL